MVVVPTGSARTAPEAPCALVPEPIDSLTVTFETDKKVYRLGRVMKVKVTVTRTAAQPASTPVEGADVTVTLRSGGDSVIQPQGGITNQDGISNVKIKIKTYHELGPADISVFVTKTQYDDGVCIHLKEQGYVYTERAVTLTQ